MLPIYLLPQLVEAGLDAAQSLLVPAASGQQLLQELMPQPLWPVELAQQEQAGQQVPPDVLDALSEAAVAASGDVEAAGEGCQRSWAVFSHVCPVSECTVCM
jgi:hypothetical protein